MTDIFNIADDAIGIAASSPAQAQGMAAHLRAHLPNVDIVPGLDSVVLRFNPLDCSITAMRAALIQAHADAAAHLPPKGEAITLKLRYGGADGPDLAGIAARLGIAEADVINAHAASTFEVAMIGFTPGFAYLSGLDARLNVPRLAAPRAHVAPGSVGISGGFCGIYALPGPGGWPIIGATDAPLFDAAREPAILLQPGIRVRFEAG